MQVLTGPAGHASLAVNFLKRLCKVPLREHHRLVVPTEDVREERWRPPATHTWPGPAASAARSEAECTRSSR